MDRTVSVVGVPTDYGADRRGVDMGPSAIRYAGLADRLAELGIECTDTGDLSVPRTNDRDPGAGSEIDRANYRDTVAEVSRTLATTVEATIDAGRLPLVLGGDHSVSIGTIAGAATNAEIGVVWFDAHGDFNTPATTPSGNIHGMSLATAVGRGSLAGTAGSPTASVAEANVALVGVRDLDPVERETLRASDVTVYSMSDVDELGISAVLKDALDVAASGVDGTHVSVDLDFLDPKTAPGVGTPVRGGATYREAHTAMEAVGSLVDRDDGLVSIEFVEVNPILDDRNETAELTTELAASALGKRII